MESSKDTLMRTGKFRKSGLIGKGLYKYKVTNLPGFQKWPPLGMTPVCFPSPSLISPWVCEKSVEGAEAAEIDLSFQESLHIKWLSGNQNWVQCKLLLKTLTSIYTLKTCFSLLGGPERIQGFKAILHTRW